MRFTVDSKVFELNDTLCIAVVKMSDVENGRGEQRIDSLLKEAIYTVQEELSNTTLGKHPKIKPWRKAYSDFKAKPSRYPCSVEALARRAVKEKKVSRINNLVDLYNGISLKHLLPIGGDDLEKVEGDLFLTRADGGETFYPLGGEKAEVINPEEVIYRDDRSVLCRRWNYRESEKTLLDEQTRQAVLFVEGLAPAGPADVKKAAEELCCLAADLVKANCDLVMIDQKNPSCVLS